MVLSRLPKGLLCIINEAKLKMTLAPIVYGYVIVLYIKCTSCYGLLSNYKMIGSFVIMGNLNVLDVQVSKRYLIIC